MPHITTFAQARKALEQYWPSKQQKHLHTLDHIHDFMDFLSNPQDKLRVIHVAGTSGKTSTAYYTAALLHAAGYKVGLTVSPHVDEINERVQLNMVPLPEAEFCRSLEHFLKLVEESGVPLSYFEVMYTFAYWHFIQARVDYAVVEVGVGGLMDSTNVVTRPDKICVITDVGLDHLSVLGDTLSEIAAQKAGIIQLHNPVFCYQQDPVVMQAIQHRAQQKQADLHILDSEEVDGAGEELPLFQQRNLRLAHEAAAWALQRDHHKRLNRAAQKLAAHTRIPGRMEIFEQAGKTVVLDVAHNAQKLAALGRSMDTRFHDQPVAALVSLVASRDYRLQDAAREMADLADHLIVTGFSGSDDGPNHSVSPNALAEACAKYGATSIEIIPDPATAFAALMDRSESVVLVVGSFYLLNHIRPLLRYKARVN